MGLLAYAGVGLAKDLAKDQSKSDTLADQGIINLTNPTLLLQSVR